MKTPDVSEAPSGDKAPKEKKQLLILGGLVLVLAVAMALQFGGGDEDAPAAAAATIAVDEQALADARAEVAAESEGPLLGNAVLSRSSDTENLPDGVFKKFWGLEEELEVETVEVPPPSITINATLCAAAGTLDKGSALAVIDGQMRREGDVIQGWTLESIRKRRVTLRSATNRLIEVSMPLLDPSNAPSMGAGAWSGGGGATAGVAQESFVADQGQAMEFTADAIAGALGGLLGGNLDQGLIENLAGQMGGGVADGAVDIGGALQSLQMDAETLDNASASQLLEIFGGVSSDDND